MSVALRDARRDHDGMRHDALAVVVFQFDEYALAINARTRVGKEICIPNFRACMRARRVNAWREMPVGNRRIAHEGPDRRHAHARRRAPKSKTATCVPSNDGASRGWMKRVKPRYST